MIVKKKAFVPPPRFMNVDEARYVRTSLGKLFLLAPFEAIFFCYEYSLFCNVPIGNFTYALSADVTG